LSKRKHCICYFVFFAKIVLSHYYKKKMDDVLNANDSSA